MLGRGTAVFQLPLLRGAMAVAAAGTQLAPSLSLSLSLLVGCSTSPRRRVAPAPRERGELPADVSPPTPPRCRTRWRTRSGGGRKMLGKERHPPAPACAAAGPRPKAHQCGGKWDRMRGVIWGRVRHQLTQEKRVFFPKSECCTEGSWVLEVCWHFLLQKPHFSLLFRSGLTPSLLLRLSCWLLTCCF